MGLKQLKSNLDLVPGTDPVGNMESISGQQFDLGPSSTLQVDSLQVVPNNSQFQDLNGLPDPDFNTLDGTTDSPYTPGITNDHMVNLLNQQVNSTNTGQTYDPSEFDIDGNPGPQFDLGSDSMLQQESLLSVPGGDSNSQYQDMDGNPGPQFDLGPDSEFHNPNSILNQYTYTHGLTTSTVDPSTLDLDGVDNGNGPFHGISNPGLGQGFQLNGVDLHEALLQNPYNYSHGNSTANILGGNTPGGVYDLNGGLPTNGEYINNLPD
jgi:hypothetical protein